MEMREQIKKFLNEEQDPKAIEKITAKLNDLLMKGEEIGYIGVQKKPAITVFPDSIVLTNKRIIMCKPKDLHVCKGTIGRTQKWSFRKCACFYRNATTNRF